MSQEEQPECPLCMEPFEVDDLNFFPCTCGYQICRFCWHRIRTDENGLCPACRKAYPENPADFKPLSQEQVAKMKAEKRHKEQQKKQKATESRKHLANVRVVQKNLVFVVGLPLRLADTHMLKKYEYFGKFGRIHKVVINQSTTYAGATGPSASAYVTYLKCDDALRAIQAVNNICVDSRTLKTSLGTTKYCSHFIKSQTCPKPDCMYLHDFGDTEASFTKEEMQQGKHQEYEKKLHEQLISQGTVERKTVSPPQGGAKQEAWPSLHLNGTGNTVQTELSENQKSSQTAMQTTNNNNNNNINNNNSKSNKTRHGKEKKEQEKSKRKGKEKDGHGLQTSQSETCISTSQSKSTNHHNRSSLLVDHNSLFTSNGFSSRSSGSKDSFLRCEESSQGHSESSERTEETPSPPSEPSGSPQAGFPPYEDGFPAQNGFPTENGFPAEPHTGFHSYHNGFLETVEPVAPPSPPSPPSVPIINDDDDELDFDPIKETQKGLADLLEKELLLERRAAEESIKYSNLQHSQLYSQPYVEPQPPIHNHIDANLLSQIHSHHQQRPPTNRMDRRPMPPPGFPSPNQALYNRGTNRTKAFPPVYIPNGVYPHPFLQSGVPKLADWPESLRSLVHENSAPIPQQHTIHQTNKGYNSSTNTFADWTALDPAIVSSSRPHLLNLHSQSLFSNQGLGPMNGTQMNMGGLGHSGWSHRYQDHFYKTHLHNTSVPPPGFSLRMPSSDMKQTLPPGIETIE